MYIYTIIFYTNSTIFEYIYIYIYIYYTNGTIFEYIYIFDIKFVF